MRKSLLLLALIIHFIGYSQTTVRKNFYVVEKENTTIAPTTLTTNNDGRLTLTFNENSLQSFFSNKNVYKYEKPFVGTNSHLLNRTYLVSISDEPNILSQLRNLTDVDFVEEIPESILLYYPNDIDVSNIGNDRALELVRAPLAWEITTGNPNILIGIPDNGFNINHEDLNTKITQHIGNTDINGFHGTMVSGFAAANTNNNIGVASIGFNSKLVTGKGYTPMAHQIAQIPGVRVINTSWVTNCSYSAVEEEVYREIWEDFGVIVVSAAGNGGTCGGPNNYVYPSAYKNYTIAVSSVGTSFPIGTIYTDANGTQYQIEWNDVHQNGINLSNPELNTHQHNDKVDLVAPGYAIPGGIMGNNVYTKCWGTSCASPQVAAAAALVLSINPNLTPNQVKNIIKNTTDDIYYIPYNQPYIGKLGTGRLNVFRAVKETKCASENNSKVDLMIKDSKEDVGHEPNNNTQYMWTSSDIFVRNQNDGKLIPVHQNPSYDGINPNYIYVRVTNMGCQTSSGADTVSVNWAKANTSLNYPEYWDGTIIQNGVVFGGLVGSGVIPVLKPGQEALVEIPWNVPNPQDYMSINSEPWHFCLLAKVNSSDDPLSSPMTPNPNIMVRNNNNLAWKNITIVNVSGNGGILGGTIAVTNPYNTVKNYL
ncbi:S8 family serine peptidase [Chryseobacterium sp.]|uniref:S8 family peptidase n=1 Tax=Chryseobacterium sp. TaxID=1871047 RepID=UPI002899DFD7|nr:S8 family serine peptidase [Chryseobacterium sp.]